MAQKGKGGRVDGSSETRTRVKACPPSKISFTTAALGAAAVMKGKVSWWLD